MLHSVQDWVYSALDRPDRSQTGHVYSAVEYQRTRAVICNVDGSASHFEWHSLCNYPVAFTLSMCFLYINERSRMNSTYTVVGVVIKPSAIPWDWVDVLSHESSKGMCIPGCGQGWHSGGFINSRTSVQLVPSVIQTQHGGLCCTGHLHEWNSLCPGTQVGCLCIPCAGLEPGHCFGVNCSFVTAINCTSHKVPQRIVSFHAWFVRVHWSEDNWSSCGNDLSWQKPVCSSKGCCSADVKRSWRISCSKISYVWYSKEMGPKLIVSKVESWSNINVVVSSACPCGNVNDPDGILCIFSVYITSTSYVNEKAKLFTFISKIVEPSKCTIKYGQVNKTFSVE